MHAACIGCSTRLFNRGINRRLKRISLLPDTPCTQLALHLCCCLWSARPEQGYIALAVKDTEALRPRPPKRAGGRRVGAERKEAGEPISSWGHSIQRVYGAKHLHGWRVSVIVRSSQSVSVSQKLQRGEVEQDRRVGAKKKEQEVHGVSTCQQKEG